MQIHYTLTETDYINFNLFHIQNSNTAMNGLKLQRFLTPVIFLIAAYFFAWNDGFYILSFSIFGIMALLWIFFIRSIFFVK